MEETNKNLNAATNQTGAADASGTATASIGPANRTVVSQSVAGQASDPSKKVNKVIKRYQNRKLYDTYQSCYVTLDEIAEMIMRGEDVTVVDNRSKKDITSATLTQIIFEKQKRSSTQIPVETLREFIQMGGGTFSGFLAKSLESGSEVLQRAKVSLERSFAKQYDPENLRGAFMITQRAADDLRRAIEKKSGDARVSREAVSAAHSQLSNLSHQLNNIDRLIEAVEMQTGE